MVNRPEHPQNHVSQRAHHRDVWGRLDLLLAPIAVASPCSDPQGIDNLRRCDCRGIMGYASAKDRLRRTALLRREGRADLLRDRSTANRCDGTGAVPGRQSYEKAV